MWIKIHLQPELIEKVNKHILMIIKMPDTCYQAYKCLENSEAVQVLQKAAEAYKSLSYQLAITHYKNSIDLLKHTSSFEESSLVTVIQYLICKCLIETAQLASLIEAKDTLINLIEITGTKYPMLYYSLSNLYIKTFCYKEAEKLINACFSILNNSANIITSYKIPTTNEIIPESSFDELSKLLVNLKEECSCWHRPDAICFMKNCNTISLNNLLDRDIYFRSPAFNGLVVVTCNSNINPCVFNFHINCWKVKKEQLSQNIKLSDKDCLKWICFTPNCENSFNESSIISKIEIYNSDNTIKSRVAITTDKLVKQQQTPSKGAVRKQKVNKVTPKITRPRNINNILNNSNNNNNNNNQSSNLKNKYHKKIKNNDEIILVSHLIKLIQARNSNYGIEVGKDWRPDLPYYGDSTMMFEDQEQYIDIVDAKDDNLKQKKSFLFSYFYQYISCNAPVKKVNLIKKWEEAKNLITDCESILYELKCPTVVEFLLKSMKFAVVGEYICTPATLPDAYKRVNNNVCGILKCLMKKVDSDSSDDDDLLDQDFFKSLNSFDTFGRFDTTEEDSKITDLNDINKIEDDSNANDEINCQNDKHKDNDQMINIEEIKENNSILIESKNNLEEKLIIENENENESNDHLAEEDNYLDNINDNQNDEVNSNDNNNNKPIKFKSSNKTCKKLEDSLQRDKQELEQTKIEFLNSKVNYLKTILYTDYMSKKNMILFNIRLVKNEYAIVDKLQNILIYSTGTMLPLSQTEWTMSLQQLEKLSIELDSDYYKKLGLINDEKYCKTIDNIVCINNSLPPLPNKDLTMFIQLAFNLYRNSIIHRAEQSFNRPSASYPPGFNMYPTNSVLVQQQHQHQQQQQRSQFLQQFFPPINFSNLPQFPSNQNNGWNFKQPTVNGNNNNNNYQNDVNGQWNPKTTGDKSHSNQTDNSNEFIDYGQLSSKNNDMKEKSHYVSYTEPPESLNNDKVLLDIYDNKDIVKELEDWKSLWADNKMTPLQLVSEEIIKEFNQEEEEQEQESENEKEEEEEELIVEKDYQSEEKVINSFPYNFKPSMDKLINLLRARNNGVLEYDLLYCIQIVRKTHNNSLTGLSFGKIITEVEKHLPSREKLQLSNYNNRFYSSTKNSNSKKLKKNLKVTSLSKSSAFHSPVKSEHGSSTKINPWAAVNNLQWTHEDTDESECIICMEVIVKFGKVPSYTLRCKHTFHKKCIKNWFNQNQSCPTCRIHSTIDDEFPPLS